MTPIKHRGVEEKPFLDDGRSVVLTTEEFEDYGLEFRAWFHDHLTSLLGEERTKTFLTQAQPILEDTFNNFGADSRTLKIIDRKGQPLELMEGYRGGYSVGELDEKPGRIFPPMLQGYINAWKEERQLELQQP